MKESSLAKTGSRRGEGRRTLERFSRETTKYSGELDVRWDREVKVTPRPSVCNYEGACFFFFFNLLARWYIYWASQVPLVVKNTPASAGDIRDPGLISRLGRSPWRRAGQATPRFLCGESHGQRSLEGYSPRGHKDSDTSEATSQACMPFPGMTNNGGRQIPKV